METNFKAIGIDEKLEKTLNKNGITEPTPVQEQAIPEILKGNDVIAQAQTGTGKTLGFMLPIMEDINENQAFIQALIITPTRELAIQVTNEAKKLNSFKDVNILSVYGGQDIVKQLKKLKRGVHIVVGTPGRLLDHIRRRSINLSKLETLVLDEADEMLNMGFLKDIEAIMDETPKQRQTMLFSATIPRQLRSLATRYMKNPSQIKAEGDNITLDEIKQKVIETTDRGKQDALCKIIDEERPFMAIIFCRTKRRVRTLNNDLNRRGYNSDEIHGDLSQAKRERAMRAFRKSKTQFLVATDVAARGLDIEGITHIFNYDIPEEAESYIHRIGRTGRAGETGTAITFVTPKDRQGLSDIERKIKMTLEKQRVVSDKDWENEASRNKSYKGKGERGNKPRNKSYKRRNSFKSQGSKRKKQHSRNRKSKNN